MPLHNLNEILRRKRGSSVTDSQPPVTHPLDRGPPLGGEETGEKIGKFTKILVTCLIVGVCVVYADKSYKGHRLAEATEHSNAALSVVDVVVVKPASPTGVLTLPGETAAWFESTIYARVDGFVGAWSADIGDKVVKGQVLATLETPDLDAQLAAARAKLQSSEAQVKARHADMDFAESTYNRWRESPKGVVSEQEREAKKADFNGASARLEEAQAQEALDRAEADRFAVMTQFKQVLAPFDGKVTERHIDIGNLVTAGSANSMTSLYRVAQTDPMRVYVDVPQGASGKMKAGVEASVTVNSIPGRTFRGKIARTADALDPKTRTLKVEIDIDNTDSSLEPGMYVDVGFNIPYGELVEVPAAALAFRPQGVFVAVVGADGKVSFHKVNIVRDDGVFVEIGEGLAEGDRAILNISSQVMEGDTVQVADTHDNDGGRAP